ncbi:MAG TPA: PadR family transcriptional regulator [Acidimicrobiia bacterium]|nr:PadR family transcriptional regulator [Acidimicrobiia bacterium]
MPGFGMHGPPFGRGRGRGMRGGQGRRRRGDVRAAALALLAERPMHGYEMIQELDERTSGVWRPSPGAVYPALQLLEDQGLVTAADVDGKRRYQLTDAGRAEVPEQAPWDDVTRGIDPVQFKLRDAIGDIALAATQVSRAGTPEQRAAAAELLARTHRGLYAILAQEPEPSAGDAS